MWKCGQTGEQREEEGELQQDQEAPQPPSHSRPCPAASVPRDLLLSQVSGLFAVRTVAAAQSLHEQEALSPSFPKGSPSPFLLLSSGCPPPTQRPSPTSSLVFVTCPPLPPPVPPTRSDSHPQTCNIQGPKVRDREDPVFCPPGTSSLPDLVPNSQGPCATLASPAGVSAALCEMCPPKKICLTPNPPVPEPVTLLGNRVSAHLTS